MEEMERYGSSGEKLGKGRPEKPKDKPDDPEKRTIMSVIGAVTLLMGGVGGVGTFISEKNSREDAMPKPGTNMTGPMAGEDTSKWERDVKEESWIVGFSALLMNGFGEDDFKNIAEKKYPTIYAWENKTGPSRVSHQGKFDAYRKAKYRVQDWIDEFNKSNPKAKVEDVEGAINNQIIALAARQKELVGKLSSQN